MDVWRHSQPLKLQRNCTFGNQPVCLQITRNRQTGLLDMNFEVKFAINLVHGLQKLEPSRTVQ